MIELEQEQKIEIRRNEAQLFKKELIEEIQELKQEILNLSEYAEKLKLRNLILDHVQQRYYGEDREEFAEIFVEPINESYKETIDELNSLKIKHANKIAYSENIIRFIDEKFK